MPRVRNGRRKTKRFIRNIAFLQLLYLGVENILQITNEYGYD